MCFILGSICSPVGTNNVMVNCKCKQESQRWSNVFISQAEHSSEAHMYNPNMHEESIVLSVLRLKVVCLS